MRSIFIFRHLWLYRALMWLLYRHQYRDRYRRVCNLIRPTDQVILELCFGDVVVANTCRRLAKTWMGLDLSHAFVAYARQRHFDAREVDLRTPTPLPTCDVCVMMGSLYQFKDALAGLFMRVKACSARFILSEPIGNWTQTKGLPRLLANGLTRNNPRDTLFRFDAASLPRTLDALRFQVGFDYRVVHTARDMLVEVTWLK